ncbi:MAG TPA: ACT domain-containing protein [Nitrospiria bacterium]|nr:ACT domain-containing protein [Nitrospiria bacterium]
MNRFAIITAAGPDRPGIVAGITRVLYETGCNIEDTSMTLLRGEFAMMLIVRLPRRPDSMSIEARFKNVQKTLGLSLLVRPLSTKEGRREPRPGGRPHILSVYGSDRPGIVYRVTRLLASRGINITDMNTRVIGPNGRPVYVMILEVDIPGKVRIGPLADALRKLQKVMKVDVALHPVESAQF